MEEGAERVDPFATNASKAFERMAQCVTAAMDKNTLDFAPYLPTFMDLYHQAALLSLNAHMVQKARAKRRVLLVRFLASALLNNFYSSKWAKSQRERKHPAPCEGVLLLPAVCPRSCSFNACTSVVCHYMFFWLGVF